MWGREGEPDKTLGLSQGTRGGWGAGMSGAPLGGQGRHSQSALDWHFNSPLPAEKAFFPRLVVERPVAPCHCPLPVFSPWWGRKEEKEAKKAKKETVTAPIPWLSIIGGGGGVRRWVGEKPGGLEEGPRLLFEKLKSFHFYSDIINMMGKSHFTSFLINNWEPECSFMCCVLLGLAPLLALMPHTSLTVFLVTSNLRSLGLFFFFFFSLDQFRMIVWEAHKICWELQKSLQ